MKGDAYCFDCSSYVYLDRPDDPCPICCGYNIEEEE